MTPSRKIMVLTRRYTGLQKRVEIGGFKAEVYGYQVTSPDGKDLGYFGPEDYSDIAFEVEGPSDSNEPI